MIDIYDIVHKTLEDKLEPSTNDEELFIDRISLVVEKALSPYLEEIEEATRHLQDTIKRLSKTG